MLTTHEPVLLQEVLSALNPQKNQNFIDGTVGGGGHAKEILDRTAPAGRLLGFDWDTQAIERTKTFLAQYKKRLILVNESYTKIKEVVYENGFYPINGILLDLGLSSDQLQISGRGFTFQQKEPLDMRYSLETDLTAEKIVNTYSEEKLIKIFSEFGEERNSKTLARQIVAYRKVEPITNTLQLVNLIIKYKRFDKRRQIHPATQVFQALRIEVNNELNNVKLVLQDCLEVLETGGRLAVITFHSLEDRIVKNYFRQESKACLCPPEIPQCRCGHVPRLKLLTKKPISAQKEEIEKNYRARSAKLRVIEKL